MRRKTALITGGTGFVGSNLCRRLVADGWSVHIISRQNDNCAQVEGIKKAITIHVHDGSQESMNEILVTSKPDIVFHLASLFLSEHLAGDIDRLITSNVLFGTQLLEAMAASSTNKIVNTGTSWQHYENKPYSPVNLYAATKQAFEDILQYYVEAKGISAITLKLFDTYGLNDPRPKLINLLNKAAKDGTLLQMSPGEQLIDLVHIDDVIYAFIIAEERLWSGVVKAHEKYGISSGIPISLKKLVELYQRVTGQPLKISWGERPYRTREVMTTWTPAPPIPHWTLSTPLEQGIQEVCTADQQNKINSSN